jgi:hypothetical protein
MTENDKKPERKVFCRRLERELPVGEHAQCPYCFGRRPDIAQGDHDEFCDFKKGDDPIQFGFPADSSRNTSE